MDDIESRSFSWLVAPDGWELRPTRTAFLERKEKSEDGSEDLLSVSQYTGVRRRAETLGAGETRLTRAASLVGYKRTYRGDLVVNTMLAWNGSMGIAPCDGIVSPSYAVYRPLPSTDSRFNAYLLTTPAYKGAIRSWSTGIQDSRLRIYPGKFLSLPLLQPPLETQQVIVRYLDHAEMRIAKAIAGKSRLVALLAERRSAIEAELLLGSQASADSTTWFGELPDGWTRLPARALCDERNERNRNDLPLLSVTIRRGVVSQQDYFSSAGSKKDQSRSDKSQYKAVQPGDVVYNKMRAWQGAAGCSALEGIVSPAYVVVRPRELIVPEFLGRVMRTPQFAKEAERWSYGINSDMWSLRPHHFKLIEFPVPPLDTQIRLLAQVVERTSAIEKALVAVENEIALLKEYRVRLISDVVTGKLDVRKEAAALPDVDPSELAAVLAGGATSTDEEEGDDGDE
jgi:type I restriction enzyme S subunit